MAVPLAGAFRAADLACEEDATEQRNAVRCTATEFARILGRHVALQQAPRVDDVQDHDIASFRACREDLENDCAHEIRGH